MTARRYAIHVGGVVLLVAGLCGVAGAAAPKDRTTLGVRLGDHSAEGYADFIIPIAANERNLIFFNPRISLKDAGAQETNVGFGYRYLWPGHKIILGANAYYDSRFSSYDNQINQYGVGLEFLSNWVDARANWYNADNSPKLISAYDTQNVTVSTVRDWRNPYARVHGIYQGYTDVTTTTTTTRRFEKFEAGLDGFDTEVGVRLPLPQRAPQVRAFVGYYRYYNPFGANVEGAKSRLEVRAAQYLTLDAEVYAHKDLNGSKYFVGARLNLPFSLTRLMQGRNPFAGAFKAQPETFADRRTEMVMRDVRVQQSQSNYIENKAAKTVDNQIVSQNGTATLLRDANFVNNGNTTGNEDGTAEHPYDTIQKGVDNAFGLKNVYVFGMTDHGYTPHTYSTNVTLTDNVKLFGSGYRFGNGGKYFGGTYPTVDGQGLGPVITLANSNQVSGFDLVNTATAASPVLATLPDGTVINTANTGIFGNGIQGNIVITNNIIHTQGGGNSGDWGDGVLLTLNGSTTATVANNSIDSEGYDTNGVTVATFGSSSVNTTIANNTIRGGLTGIEVDTFDGSHLAATITNNNITGESEDGIELNTNDNSSLLTTVSNNTVSTSGDDGIELNANDNSSATGTISGNTVTATGSDVYGITIYGDSSPTVTVNLLNNRITTNGNDAYAVDAEAHDNTVMNITASGNTIVTTGYGTATGAGSYGIYLQTSTTGVLNATLNNNNITTYGDSADAVEGWAYDNSFLNVSATANTMRTLGQDAYGMYTVTEDSGTLNVNAIDNSIVVTGNNTVGIFVGSKSTVTANVSGNKIIASGSGADGIDLYAYNPSGSLPTSTLNGTVNNNVIAAAANGIDVYASDSGTTVCGALRNNLIGAGSGIKLEQYSSATLNIVDNANLGANNNGAGVNSVGTITSVGGCP